jgi:hypothetical protein
MGKWRQIMTPIVLDASAADQLRAIPHSVHLCDPSGKIFGRFIPLHYTGDISSIVFDAEVTSQLKQVNYRVELCEPSGNALGYFYARISGVDTSEWEPVSPEISDEELDEIENSNQRTYTTAELIAHLKSL